MKILQLTITLTLCIIFSSIILLQHANASVDARPSGIVSIDLKLNKESYFSGDSVFINGKLWLINATHVTIGIEKNHNLIVTTKNVTVSENKIFATSFTIPKDMDAKSWSIVATASGSTLIQDLNFYPVPLSPLEQFKSGTPGQYVVCKEDFILVTKTSYGPPACVKLHTSQTLAERGWMLISMSAQQNIPVLSNSLKISNTNSTINYNIAGNGKILDIKQDVQSKSLILSFETTSNGTLTVSVPRALLDIAKSVRGEGPFGVLTDGREASFTQIRITATDRIFSIPFTIGTHEIEIFVTQII